MRVFFLFLIVLVPHTIYSQPNYPKNYFRSPVASTPWISSNFGEIRPNHFHAGFDYGTGGRVGDNLYAIGDGYVSRVKVSSRGYGKAVYLNHPNGFVSVYAHLDSFMPGLDEYIQHLQYERQEFELDEYLPPWLFPVKKGQVVGKSGNTGHSYKPHLHFEIRDKSTQEPLNPFLFGFNYKDTEAPKYKGLYIYSFKKGYENHPPNERKLIKIKNGQVVNAYGTIGFGIEIHDYMRRGGNRFGTYSMELYINGQKKFSYQMDRISFDESKYLNSFADFELYRKMNLKVTKCFIEPNNKLRIYTTEGNGLYDFSDGKTHEIKIIAKDFPGNTMSLNFKIKSDPAFEWKNPVKPNSNLFEINCMKEYTFRSDSVQVYFPMNALYTNIDFKYVKTKRIPGSFSETHHIHDAFVPLHNRPVLSIKPYPIPEGLRQKALIAGIGGGQRSFSAGGKWNGDYIETNIGSFGVYYVAIDSINPIIEPKNFTIGGKQKSETISFKITDNLSGIGEYIAYIDNDWVLFEYDEKNNLIFCNLEKNQINKGEHELIIWVRDKVGNIASYDAKFLY
jgi:murein DD-endopeptidase MepM/ murein hydrolase activator NlpD